MTDLSVIIVTWNSRHYLEACLRSLPGAALRVSTHVIVVDNQSTDGSAELIESSFPAVQLVRNAENAGFAAANNQAMRLVRSRYVLLLNPDTVVDPHAFDTLVEFMDTHPAAWAAGPAMKNGDGSPQRTGVTFPNEWNLFCETFFLDRLFPQSRLVGRHRALYEDPARSRRVDYLQGSCLIVRHEVLTTIGGLDEQFFMYFEETDWCYRMHEAGGAVMYCPGASVIHFGGGDMAHYDERRVVFYHRSLFQFYRKHYSRAARLRMRVIIAVRSCVRAVLWLCIAALSMRKRSAAFSAARGYWRTMGLVFSSVGGV